MTKTIKGIPYGQPAPGRWTAQHLVMVGHAGRMDRTGAKVHLASLTTWESGKSTVGATHCSGNGMLRGGLTFGADFAAVTCKKCGASAEAAERRNASAVDVVVTF